MFIYKCVLTSRSTDYGKVTSWVPPYSVAFIKVLLVHYFIGYL